MTGSNNRDRIIPSVKTRSLLKYLFLLGTILLMIYIINPLKLVSTLSQTNLSIFFGTVAAWSGVSFVFSVRWQKVLRSIGMDISMTKTWKLFNIGNLYNMVLPGAVGGDAVKVIFLIKEVPYAASATLSVVYDRIIALIGIIAFGCISSLVYAMFFDSLYIIYVPIFLSVFFAAIAGLYVVTSRKCISHLKKYVPDAILAKLSGQDLQHLRASLQHYRDQPHLLGVCLLLTFLGQGATYVIIYFLGAAVGIEPSSRFFFASMVFLPLIFLASTLPLTPSGLGITELTFVALYRQIGIPPETAVAIQLLYRASLALFTLHTLSYINQFGKEYLPKTDEGIPGKF